VPFVGLSVVGVMCDITSFPSCSWSWIIVPSWFLGPCEAYLSLINIHSLPFVLLKLLYRYSCRFAVCLRFQCMGLEVCFRGLLGSREEEWCRLIE